MNKEKLPRPFGATGLSSPMNRAKIWCEIIKARHNYPKTDDGSNFYTRRSEAQDIYEMRDMCSSQPYSTVTKVDREILKWTLKFFNEVHITKTAKFDSTKLPV